MTESENLLSVQDLAEKFQVSTHIIYRLYDKGYLPVVKKIKNVHYWGKKDIIKFLVSCQIRDDLHEIITEQHFTNGVPQLIIRKKIIKILGMDSINISYWMNNYKNFPLGYKIGGSRRWAEEDIINFVKSLKSANN